MKNNGKQQSRFQHRDSSLHPKMLNNFLKKSTSEHSGSHTASVVTLEETMITRCRAADDGADVTLPPLPSFISDFSPFLSRLQQPGGGRVSVGTRSRCQRAGQRRAHSVTQRCLVRGETLPHLWTPLLIFVFTAFALINQMQSKVF